MRRDFRRQLLGPEDAVRRQRLVRQPIQLPRRSAVAIPKHFRDICYARRVHGRRPKQGPPFWQRVHKVRRVCGSYWLQSASKRAKMIRVWARVMRRDMLQTDDADPLTKWNDLKERLRAYLLLLVWALSDAGSAR